MRRGLALLLALAALLAVAVGAHGGGNGKPQRYHMTGVGSVFAPPYVDLESGYVSDEWVVRQSQNSVTYTVPSGYYAILLLVDTALTADATAGNRTALLTIIDPNYQPGSQTGIRFPSPQQIAPSTTMAYAWSVDVSTVAIATASYQTVQIPAMFWRPQTQFNVSLQGPIAADTVQNPTLFRVVLFHYTQPADVQNPPVAPTPLLT